MNSNSYVPGQYARAYYRKIVLKQDEFKHIADMDTWLEVPVVVISKPEPETDRLATVPIPTPARVTETEKLLPLDKNNRPFLLSNDAESDTAWLVWSLVEQYRAIEKSYPSAIVLSGMRYVQCMATKTIKHYYPVEINKKRIPYMFATQEDLQMYGVFEVLLVGDVYGNR